MAPIISSRAREPDLEAMLPETMFSIPLHRSSPGKASAAGQLPWLALPTPNVLDTTAGIAPDTTRDNCPNHHPSLAHLLCLWSWTHCCQHWLHQMGSLWSHFCACLASNTKSGAGASGWLEPCTQIDWESAIQALSSTVETGQKVETSSTLGVQESVWKRFKYQTIGLH